MKLLLDTDIGCDIDDNYALGYLLARHDAEIVGITTVSGEPEKRAMLADQLCKLAGKPIEIRVGAENAIDGGCRQGHVSQIREPILAKYPHGDFKNIDTAPEFMREKIDSAPGELILCAIGQLTNVAHLFTKYPETIRKLKKLVVMGGRFGDGYDTKRWGEIEWNILCDKEAARIVFAAPIDIDVVGIELTNQFHKNNAELTELLKDVEFMRPTLESVRPDQEIWFHDPLTVSTLFDPENAVWERGKVTVIDGATNFEPDETGNVRVARKIDQIRFFNHYFKAIRE